MLINSKTNPCKKCLVTAMCSIPCSSMYKYYRSRLKFLRKILEWNPIVTAMSCFLFYFLAVFYKVVSGFGGIMASILIILVVCIISLFIQSRILKPRIKLTNNIVEMLSVKGFFND